MEIKKLILILKYVPFVRYYWNKFKASKEKELAHMQKIAYYQTFSNFCYGCFWGEFNSFEDACAKAPKTKSLNWNSKEQAEWERDQFNLKFSKIESFDYPVLHWISKINKNYKKQLNFFDFGGGLGNHYYAYKKALPELAIRCWKVCDVPLITKHGIEFKIKNNAKEIDFTNCIDQEFKADVFLASGSLQYVDELKPTFFLKSFATYPRYIIINRIPLLTENHKPVITLQNLHNSFAPMRTYNFGEFFSNFKYYGYEILDIWKDFSSNCKIPEETKFYIPYYHGVCMKLH